MRRRPLSSLAALAGLVLVCGGCGGGAPAPPPRLKLAHVAAGRLERPAADGATQTLLEPDELGGWRVTTEAERPLAPDPALLSVTVDADDGPREGLGRITLSGRRGAVYRLLQVEPGACYAFEAQVRDRGLVAASEPFFGATTWLAELTRAGTPDELLGDGIETFLHVRHLFQSALGSAGWQTRARLFRTGPETRSLLVAGLLGLSEEVSAGAVDFAGLTLRRVPDRAFWGQELAREVRQHFAGESTPDDWRGERLVRATLGAEARPSIVLLPGETLRLLVRVPRGSPVLETGFGPWPTGVVPGRRDACAVTLEVEGQELLRAESTAPAQRADLRWSEHVVDLTRFAGETVELTLRASGATPCALGAALLRDAAYVPTEPNLVLISIDTLRADRVGAYGHAGGNTPHLDALAAEGIRFAQAISQAPYTLPSHASMLSGQLPIVHGVQKGGDVFSPGRSPILARILGEQGYRTQAFTGAGFVKAVFGFDQGFDGFDDVDPMRPAESRYFQLLPPDLVAEHGPQLVLDWIAAHADQPFFLFVHTYVVHDYDPPAELLTCHDEGCTSERTDFRDWRLGARYIERGRTPLPISPADRAHIDHLYDTALRHADAVVGTFLDRLDTLGIAERTLVAVTSDHGEEMFERGFLQHGKTVYEETTRVPLILRIPGLAPRVIAAPAMLIDLTPTLLGAMGIPADARMQGIDLLRHDPGERMLWSEVDDYFSRKYALRDAQGWKLIHSPADDELLFPGTQEWELYDLTRDPGEASDLSVSSPAELVRLQQAFEQRRAALLELGASLGEVGQGEVDEETAAQLRALGYMR